MNSFLLLRSFSERCFYLFTQFASFAVALHLSRRRTNTRTRTHTHWHTFVWLCICIVSDKDSAAGQGGRCEVQRVQCNLKRNNHTQRGTTRKVRREKRTGTVGVEFIFCCFCCCYFYSIIFCPPPSSLLPPPSLLPSPLSFHYFAQISSYIKKKELGLPYTAHIRIYMTGSICLLQLTAA